MSDELPLDYIRETVYELIHKDAHGQVDISTDVEREHWPLEFGDIITEVSVKRKGDTVVIMADEQTESRGYEFSRRNATGGTYGDLKQNISINAVLNVTSTEEVPRISKDNPGKLNAFCEVSVSNVKEYPGESPPF